MKYGDGGGVGAPLEVNEDLLTTFNISAVVRGSVSETGHTGHDDTRYGVPRSKGIFRCPPPLRVLRTTGHMLRLCVRLAAATSLAISTAAQSIFGCYERCHW